MAVQFYEFGKLPDGRSVTAAKLTNHAGASLTVLDYGITVRQCRHCASPIGTGNRWMSCAVMTPQRSI